MKIPNILPLVVFLPTIQRGLLVSLSKMCYNKRVRVINKISSNLEASRLESDPGLSQAVALTRVNAERPLYLKGGGVYQILNTVNGKRYIGSTVNLRTRRNDHWRALKQRNHYNHYLQNAWNRYGKKSFSFEVLEYILDPKQLIEREQHYFDILKPKYNLSLMAKIPWNKGIRCPQISRIVRGRISHRGGTVPRLHTEETCRKLKALGGKPKLIESKVREICFLLAEGKLSQRRIASMFGVSYQTIWLIKEGFMWKHVTKIKEEEEL